MKKILGLSLPELMVSIAVVSVVGAGMYVGFQQIDSAQERARESVKNSNQTGLLLDLIETETGRAGLGLDSTSEQSTCLVAWSGSEWKSSCEGDLIPTQNSAHGLLTCRKNGDQYVSTLFYSSGPHAYASAPEKYKDLRCGQEGTDSKFFDVYSLNLSSAACSIPAYSELGPANLRSESLCTAEFALTQNGVNVNLTTSGHLTSEANGNVFSFANRSSQTEQAQLNTAETLLEVVDPYLVTFENSRFLLASGATTTFLRLDRPALEQVSVTYAVINSDGSLDRQCDVTIMPGETVVQIPDTTAEAPCDGSFEAGDTLQILTSNNAIAGEINEFELIDSTSDAAPETTSFRLAFSQNTVAYGDDPITFFVVADRMVSASSLSLITENNASSSISIGDGGTPTATEAGVLSQTTITLNGTSSRFPITLTPRSDQTLESQSFEISMSHPDSTFEVSDSHDIWLTSETSASTVFWLQNSGTLIRPIRLEDPRSVVATLVAEPPPTQQTVVYLNNASGTASCGPEGTADYWIQNLNAASATCNFVTIKPGAERSSFKINVRENTTGTVSPTAKLSIVASGSRYIPNESRDALSVGIEDYAVPHFDLTTATVELGSASATGAPDNLSTFDAFLSHASTPVIGYASAADNRIYLFEDTGTLGWNYGEIPVSLTGGSSTSAVQIRALRSASTAERFRLGVTSGSTPTDFYVINNISEDVTIPFWVKNDETEFKENGSNSEIELEIIRASGDARSRRPDPDSVPSRMYIRLVDSDQCGIGDGMTIGDSRADHFHTVGLDDMTNENVTAATVRISSGYDSSNDILLIDGITPTTATNITTYSGGSVTYNGITYNNITSKFYTNQGVLEISRSSAIPAPAMVKFFNESVFFQSTATGNTARSATFTLGDAQAWDMHEDGTTHYYRFVPDDVVFFNTARLRAASASNAYFGVPGYLATVTSRAENTFLAEKFNDNGGAPAGWLGGWDRNLDGTANEGKWIWMNGPEAGRRFLSGNTTSSQYKVVRGAGNGDGTAASITRSDYQQEVAVNGSDHTPNDSFELWNMRYNEYSESVTNGKVTHPSNPYRFSNFARGEPNNCCGGVEHYLQMTGNSRGGRLWNDLPDELGSIIGNTNPNYGSPISPYYVRGYYQEFGGPAKSQWGFYNRKFSQTNNFTTGACSVTKSTAGVGLTQDSCEAWSDLTIGTGTAASSGFDFFGPNSSVSGQNISSARVSISSGYVSGTDELVIDGITANTSTVGQKKYLNFAVNYNGTNYDNIDAIFFINQGVMEITRYTDANGSTKATMPANAMVQLFNEKVEFVHDPSGNGLVSSSERQVTYTLGEAQAWFNHEDGGTRYYRYVPEHLTWWQARDAAQSDAQDYFGVEGYLATVTSKAENDFLADKFNDNGGPPAGWLNGRDWGSGSGSGSQNAQNEGKWRWAGGPEAGRHFWRGNGTSGKYISGTGNNTGTEHTVTKDCVQQTEAWNGHAHVNGYLHRLDYGYTETLTNGVPSGSVGSTTNARFANWSCYNSDNGMEPNNAGSGAGEDFLQLNGGAKGGGMWNDLKHDQATGTGVYNIKGYYIEYGGPAGYSHRFSDRQLGATFRINPQECALVRVD